jgi:hypothetical protein
MTTATSTGQPVAGTPISRITRIVKLNMTNPWTTIVMPWLVLFAIFALSWAIWLIIYLNADPADRGEISDGTQYSGASWWIFVYMLVVAVQAMNLTFPLALGYGVTRRDFYLGSALTFVLLSAMWAVGLTILSVIEEATNGWGIGGTMFTSLYFGGDGAEWWQRTAIYFLLMLFFFFVGAAVAAMYVRWRMYGLISFFFVLGLLLVGAIALITSTQSWPAVGEFFVVNQALGVAIWSLVPTAVAGIAGFFILRRATPRS